MQKKHYLVCKKTWVRKDFLSRAKFSVIINRNARTINMQADMSLRNMQISQFRRQSKIRLSTVQPAKSDSGKVVCLQSYQDLESIYHLCINPIYRIGLIHK